MDDLVTLPTTNLPHQSFIESTPQIHPQVVNAHKFKAATCITNNCQEHTIRIMEDDNSSLAAKNKLPAATEDQINMHKK